MRRAPLVIAALMAILAVIGAAVAVTEFDRSASQQCLSGKLLYEAPDAEAGTDLPVVSAPARRIDWEMVEHDGDGPRVVDRGRTGLDGRWRACAEGDVAHSMRFLSSSSATEVAVVGATDGDVLSFDTKTTSGTRDFGDLVVGDDIAPSQAWKVVDTVGMLYDARSTGRPGCWTNLTCDRLVIRWAVEPGSEDSYFDEASNQVILGHKDAQSKHVIIHEAAHWFQYNVQGPENTPVVTDCEHHEAAVATSTTCAWTEGFAVATSAHFLGDTRHVFDDGEEVDVRGLGEIAGWDDGDEVEGRVAGSLLDIWDRVDAGDWSSSVDVLAQPLTDFRDYFDARVVRDPELEDQIVAVLADHTIDYR
ncbi:hypothetical protein [Gordonia malaquae]|uniref:hypothetical protein n=1 Tax=Gordonia malaquae TaxID=410332 RepID=UPI00301A956F